MLRLAGGRHSPPQSQDSSNSWPIYAVPNTRIMCLHRRAATSTVTRLRFTRVSRACNQSTQFFTWRRCWSDFNQCLRDFTQPDRKSERLLSTRSHFKSRCVLSHFGNKKNRPRSINRQFKKNLSLATNYKLSAGGRVVCIYSLKLTLSALHQESSSIYCKVGLSILFFAVKSKWLLLEFLPWKRWILWRYHSVHKRLKNDDLHLAECPSSPDAGSIRGCQLLVNALHPTAW